MSWMSALYQPYVSVQNSGFKQTGQVVLEKQYTNVLCINTNVSI